MPMMSCICLGIGEAFIVALIAGGTGLGAHAASCKPPKVGSEPTCCNHDHQPAAPAPTTPDLRRATRLSGSIALIAFCVFSLAMCGESLLEAGHSHDRSDIPCEEIHNDHDHDLAADLHPLPSHDG